jgi:hypothetical protein
MNNKSKWDSLTLKEKSEVMKMAISSGVIDLDNIRSSYNSFAEGGPTERREHSEKREQRDSTNPHNYKTEVDPYREFVQPPEYTKYELQDPAVLAEIAEGLGNAPRAMNTSFKDKNGNVLGYTVPSGVEETASFMPILGTAMDIYEYVNNPTWENAGYAIISLAAELPILKGLKAIKSAKAAKLMNKYDDAVKAYNKAETKVKRMENTPNLNYKKINQARQDLFKAYSDMHNLDPEFRGPVHEALNVVDNIGYFQKVVDPLLLGMDAAANYSQLTKE